MGEAAAAQGCAGPGGAPPGAAAQGAAGRAGEKEKLARDCAAAEQQLRGLHRALARVEEVAARSGGAGAAPIALVRLEKVAFLRGKVEAMEAELGRRKAHLAALKEKKHREAEAAAAALSPQRRQRAAAAGGGAKTKSVVLAAAVSQSSAPSSPVRATARSKDKGQAALPNVKAKASSSGAREAALEAEERRLARALLELGQRAQQREKKAAAAAAAAAATQHRTQQQQQQQQQPAKPPPTVPAPVQAAAKASKGKRELARVEARLQACLATFEALPGAAAGERARGHEEVARLDRELRRLRGAVEVEVRQLSPSTKAGARPIPEAGEEEEEEEEGLGDASSWWPPQYQGEEEDEPPLPQQQHFQQESLLEEDDLEEVWQLAGEVERVSSRLSSLQQPLQVQQQQP